MSKWHPVKIQTAKIEQTSTNLTNLLHDGVNKAGNHPKVFSIKGVHCCSHRPAGGITLKRPTDLSNLLNHHLGLQPPYSQRPPGQTAAKPRKPRVK